MAFVCALRRFLGPAVAAAAGSAACSAALCESSSKDKKPTNVSLSRRSAGVQASVCHSGVTQGFAGTVGNTPLIGTSFDEVSCAPLQSTVLCEMTSQSSNRYHKQLDARLLAKLSI